MYSYIYIHIYITYMYICIYVYCVLPFAGGHVLTLCSWVNEGLMSFVYVHIAYSIYICMYKCVLRITFCRRTRADTSQLGE